MLLVLPGDAGRHQYALGALDAVQAARGTVGALGEALQCLALCDDRQVDVRARRVPGDSGRVLVSYESQGSGFSERAIRVDLVVSSSDVDEARLVSAQVTTSRKPGAATRVYEIREWQVPLLAAVLAAWRMRLVSEICPPVESVELLSADRLLVGEQLRLLMSAVER